MKNFWSTTLIALGLLLEGCSTPSRLPSSPPIPFNPWAEMPGPSSGPSESIGSYDRGCLAGGAALREGTPGLQIMRPGRRRYFGHPSLIAYLERVGREATHAGIPTVLVGDLGHPRGGPHFHGHRSHQSGLDVDLWFWGPDTAEPLSLEVRENLSARSMIKDSGLDPELWKPSRHPILLRIAAASPSVERIFIAPEIKRQLCLDYGQDPTNTFWLQKLRPWWNHADHLHVRLVCPPGDLICKAQAPLPPGNGCDPSLDWWFSEEAHLETLKQAQIAAAKAGAYVLPELPTECQALLPHGEKP